MPATQQISAPSVTPSTRTAVAADDPTSDLVGHVLRRLTFGPTPEQRTRFESSSPTDVIRALLSDDPIADTPPSLTSDEDDDYGRAIDWWIDVMRRPQAGIHERMVWFWHGHITSGLDKSSPHNMLVQLQLLRTHALGNFRTLLQEITLDPAMLYWLDGSDSSADAPNENYAREVMELFALGRHSGAYTEADVRAGAKALAGYWVGGDDDSEVGFESESALTRPVTFLGEKVRTAEEVINTICDHPMCARFVASSVYESFVGSAPPDDRLDVLAKVFREADLEIAPLVEEIVTHESFLDQPLSRPRSALEWFLAFERLVGTPLDTWILELLGQMPLNPPNVAGWPNLERWVSSGAVLTKAQAAIDYSWDAATLDDADPVGDVIARAGMLTVTTSTRDVLESLNGQIESRRERSSLLHAAIAMSPEFSLT